jgi:hypothetical protein
MLAILPLAVVLAGAFAFTFAMMWGMQRLGCFDDPALRTVGRRQPARLSRSPLGPDDDLAFLRELRRRIDLGHFRP